MIDRLEARRIRKKKKKRNLKKQQKISRSGINDRISSIIIARIEVRTIARPE